ncbi:MAG: rRNA pseudouridine synthase [Lachnospiraceae bacterium]|nr:rRNA pseudouridine synthase [Lachnospiraceae bacterium]
MIRLDRFLAGCGTGSRKHAVSLIKAGRVSVNGTVIHDPGHKINEDAAVCLDDEALIYERYSYYMLNKPAGCVSAVKDRLSDTVLSYLTGVNHDGLFPVGRLDKDTEGLLIITNDGELCHRIISPKKHVDKVYYVICDKALPKGAAAQFKKGLDIGDDVPCLPAKLKSAGAKDGKSSYELTITEGRFHQVKRMIMAMGRSVVYLKRINIGGVKLDDSLSPGQFRALTHDEIVTLKNAAGYTDKEQSDEAVKEE